MSELRVTCSLSRYGRGLSRSKIFGKCGDQVTAILFNFTYTNSINKDTTVHTTHKHKCISKSHVSLRLLFHPTVLPHVVIQAVARQLIVLDAPCELT